MELKTIKKNNVEAPLRVTQFSLEGVPHLREHIANVLTFMRALGMNVIANTQTFHECLRICDMFTQMRNTFQTVVVYNEH